MKTDRASMAHSLEARVPFLDPVVAELALALPTLQKVRGFAKKRLLRKAVAPLLPREILRGRKRGFSIPAAAWLRGDLSRSRATCCPPTHVRRQGFFRPEAVTGLLDGHVARQGGPQPPDLGAADVLPLARPLRRGGKIRATANS